MVCASLPLETGRLISPFGWRNRPSGPDLHTGVDFGTAEGTNVLAVLDGTVKNVYPQGTVSGYGNLVVLEHTDRLYSLYAHLKDILVEKGEQLLAGDLLGTVGRTAGTREEPQKQFASSGAHLHFEFLDRWPPRGRDLDRFDPGPIFQWLGIVVPEKGELIAAAGLPAACTETRAPVLLEPTFKPPGRLRKAAAFGGLVGFFLLSALFLSDKKKTGARYNSRRR